jgi:hypothetical protein
MTDTNRKFSQDEELSNFTDQVLKGQMKNIESPSNEELRELEETILRLHNTMPSSKLEESTKKQMLVRLNARIRREKEQPQKKSFWASLFDMQSIKSQSRPQFFMTIGIAALVVLAVVIAPDLVTGSSGSTVGTALDAGRNIIVPAILLGLIAIILWVTRKK